MRLMVVTFSFVLLADGGIASGAAMDTADKTQNTRFEIPSDQYFQPKRFANGMSVLLRLKGTHEQAFSLASNAFHTAGLRLTKLNKADYVLGGVPEEDHKELADIDTISIEQIQFMPRPDFKYVEWHVVLFWKDGILRAKTDPTFRTDPKVTKTLESVLKKLFDSISKDMPPISPSMPRPE